MREYRKTHKSKPDKRTYKDRVAWIRQYQRNRRVSDPVWAEKERKRLNEYNKNRRKTDPEWKKLCYQRHTVWARKNREHLNNWKRKYYQKPEQRLKQKIRLIKRLYGISYDEYLEKIKKNNGNCPICKDSVGSGAVDHNHKTGKVRDVLCSSCNGALGLFKDNVPNLESAIIYLKKWEEV